MIINTQFYKIFQKWYVYVTFFKEKRASVPGFISSPLGGTRCDDGCCCFCCCSFTSLLWCFATAANIYQQKTKGRLSHVPRGRIFLFSFPLTIVYEILFLLLLLLYITAAFCEIKVSAASFNRLLHTYGQLRLVGFGLFRQLQLFSTGTYQGFYFFVFF